jgi:3D (Asp-Asp-Asp) domain-containing protein
MPTPTRTRSAVVAFTAFTLALWVGACTERTSTSPPPQVVTAPTPAAPKTRAFEATAYTIEGTTASGKETRDGIVAADPRILPLGTRIRVSDAGAYSGEYEVADTGREIKGQELDIYIRNGAEAKRFGRKVVQVEVLEIGNDKVGQHAD